VAIASYLEDETKRSRATTEHRFYGSDLVSAGAEDMTSVSVDISITSGSARELGQAIVATAKTSSGSKGILSKAILEGIAKAVIELVQPRFAEEAEKLVEAYRLMLRESLAKGADAKLQAALNRARLQEKILATTSMVDQSQACALLGMSPTNPSATMKRKEDKQEVLRFTLDGRAAYPLFQFDVEGRRIFPAMARLIKAKPRDWSDFRLLYWLTRPHLDFEGTPAEALGTDEDEVLAAFHREIAPAGAG